MNFVKILISFLQKKTKVFIYSFFLLLSFLSFALPSNRGLSGFEHQEIDASKNARLHSNMGNIFFEEKNYPAALKEYEIAYNLTYKKAQSSVYLYNIARCFMVQNNYFSAKNALLGAIKKDYMNITYYEALSECIVKLKQAQSEIVKYSHDEKNPYNKILIGLIYLKIDKKFEAKQVLDGFLVEYPELIITPDVKRILNNI